jgi:hypothetical protein
MNAGRSWLVTLGNSFYFATAALRQCDLSVAYFDVAFTPGVGNHGLGQS